MGVIYSYLTTVNLNSSSAESIQTNAMIRSFRKIKKTNFELYTDREYSQLQLDNISIFESYRFIKRRVFRQLLVLTCFYFKKKKCDYVVFAREFLLAIVPFIFGGKVFFELHKIPSKKIQWILSKIKSRRFCIIAISASLEIELKSINPSLYIKVEHDCVDISRYQLKVRSQKGVPPLNVVYTGSLYKGRDIFVIAQSARQFPDLDFSIYGGNATEIAKLKNDIEFRQLENVHFYGLVDFLAVPKIQEKADILFFPLTRTNPLWKSTSPLKLFEYMASGTPIVASCIGPISELLTANIAYLFDPEDGATLKEAISTAIKDVYSGHSQRPRNAIDFVAYYTWDKRIERICNL